MLKLRESQVTESLAVLQESGRQGCEGIVLWLGRRYGADVEVVEVYRPIHQAREDMFLIPSEGMRALHAKQREGRLFVAAQLHSHPGQAFHSAADDRWAIVRHAGALSLVLPTFALNTSPQSFFKDLKVYRMTIENRWIEVPPREVNESCQIY